MLDVGATTIEEPVPMLAPTPHPPAYHVKIPLPPLAESVVELPEQIVVLVATMETGAVVGDVTVIAMLAHADGGHGGFSQRA